MRNRKIFEAIFIKFKYSRHFFAVFFAGVFLSCSKSPTNTEEPKRHQIEVAGSIAENTIWESGKDYIVRGVVTVEENATLTIEKDVYIYLTKYTVS